MKRSTIFSHIVTFCLVLVATGCFQLPEVDDSVDENSSIAAELRISGIRLGTSYLVVQMDFESSQGETMIFERIIPVETNEGFVLATWDNLKPGAVDVVINGYVGLNRCQSLNQPFNQLSSTGTTTLNLIMPEATDDCGLDQPDEDGDMDEIEEAEPPEIEEEIEEEQIQREKKTATAYYVASAQAPKVDGTLGFGEYDAAQATQWSNPTMGQPSKLWLLYDDSRLYFGMLLSSFSYIDGTENSVNLLIDYQGQGQSAFSFKIHQPATGATPETHCIIVPGGLEECFRLEQGWQDSEVSVATGEWSDAWLAEVSIPFARLGIVPGVSKVLALSVVQTDLGNRMAWSDDTVDEVVPSGWDWLESENAWNSVTTQVDGDEEMDEDDIEPDDDEVELEVEADEDPIEEETDRTEITEELEQEEEAEAELEEEAEQEDETISCNGNQVECIYQGQYPIARKCNSAGTGYDWQEVCDFDHPKIAGHDPQCGSATCIPGGGASAGCYYQFSNTYPPPTCNVGSFCYETGVCRQENGWEVCDAPERSCDDNNECTEDSCNPAASDWESACENTAARQGQSCTADNECFVESYCDNGVCSGTVIPGCCPGHSDMVKVTDQYCIDMYEGVLSDSDNCSIGTLYGQNYSGATPDFHAFFPTNGQNVTTELYACSIQGVKPSAWLTKAQAERACSNQGKRLCSPTEWSLGCGNGQTYPYGDTYTPLRCADRSHMTVGSGSRATGLPVEDDGTYYYCSWNPSGTDDVQPYDASGNVSEWIETGTQDLKYCGGSYIDLDGSGPQQSLSCQSCKTADSAEYYTDILGFRCCVNIQ